MDQPNKKPFNKQKVLKVSDNQSKIDERRKYIEEAKARKRMERAQNREAGKTKRKEFNNELNKIFDNRKNSRKNMSHNDFKAKKTSDVERQAMFYRPFEIMLNGDKDAKN